MNSTCELGDDAARVLKPYPAYQDSSIEWLGDVPEHWEVVRLRNTSEMRVSNVDKHAKDDEQPVRLCNYVDVYKNDRIRSGMAFMRATATTDEIERFRLQSGDVLIVVAVPPTDEQLEIVRLIAADSKHLNNAISAAQRGVGLIREYRTRLIADVVTGKLDVREVAAGLPDVDSLAADDTLDGGNAPHDVSDSESEVATSGCDERSGSDGYEVRA